MRITSKGQVTVPQEIREKLGLLPHTEVDFEMSEGRVFIVKTEQNSGRGKKIVDKMRGKGTVSMTTDEIMALTRG